jgi:hypothetical protein
MYPEHSRRVFRYQVGNQLFYADPMAALRTLKLCCGGRLTALTAQHNVIQGFSQDGTERQAPPPEGTPEHLTGLAARGEIARATIQAFGLPPFDQTTGEGTLEEEAISLYVEFMAYLNAKKNSTGN